MRVFESMIRVLQRIFSLKINKINQAYYNIFTGKRALNHTVIYEKVSTGISINDIDRKIHVILVNNNNYHTAKWTFGRCGNIILHLNITALNLIVQWLFELLPIKIYSDNEIR